MTSMKYAYTLCASLFTALPLAASGAEIHWSYEGEAGPAHWGDLAPEFHLCKDGKQQSGIDIPGVSGADDLAHIRFDYKTVPLKIVNNGHTIQVNYAAGSKAMIDGDNYQLLQFHFHTPSEHNKKGASFPMEVHLVHRNAAGQLAVVGVLMKEGHHNDFIQKIWDRMPAHEGEVDVHADINAARLLPRERDFFRYAGSLTTPPCSEGVKWSVMAQPIEVSAAQIAQFRAIFPLNARPVQPLNGRPISTNDD